MANVAGTVAAAPSCETVRKAIRVEAFQATAVRMEKSTAVAMPRRYRRRCPRRSPSRPSTGVATAPASTGAVLTHVMVVGSECSSSAIGLTEMVRIVIGKEVEKIPMRHTSSSARG